MIYGGLPVHVKKLSVAGWVGARAARRRFTGSRYVAVRGLRSGRARCGAVLARRIVGRCARTVLLAARSLFPILWANAIASWMLS